MQLAPECTIIARSAEAPSLRRSRVCAHCAVTRLIKLIIEAAANSNTGVDSDLTSFAKVLQMPVTPEGITARRDAGLQPRVTRRNNTADGHAVAALC